MTIGAAGAHLQATTMELSRFNSGWNGTAAFFNLALHHGALIQTPGTAFPDDVDRYILISPYAPSVVPEADRILTRGGTVVIADEEEGLNTILVGLGSEMRIVQGNVSSIDMEFDSPGLVIASAETDHPLLKDVEKIVFNRPSFIVGGEPLVQTSLLSWLDHHGDGRYPESFERFTLVAREEIGTGELILIADSSLFITSMQQAPRLRDNPQLMINLLSSEGVVLLDAVHGRTADADGTAYYIHKIKSFPLSTVIIILVLMIILALAVRRQIL